MQGWQAKVREELGISDDTARRIIERGQYVAMLDEVRRGEPIQYITSRREPREVLPTGEMSKLAAEALENVARGAVAPKRAWAGVVGEANRSAGNSAGAKDRAPVNHFEVLRQALVSLRNSLPHWSELDIDERAELERLWLLGERSKKKRHIAPVWSLIPETWKA
jgi:hypothetical protein